MKKLLFHCKRCAVVLLALTAAFAVGCTGDLEDEVADLTGQVEDLESSLAELEDKITDGGITVTSVVTNSDGSKTIYFSDGSVVSTSSSSSSDVEVLADVDEFCVLSIEGTEYVVAKTDYVTLTDVSLKGVTDLYPVMKSGETYDISVKLNPSNTTVVPTAYYLVVVAEGSSSAGVTVKSLMGTESTVVVVDSFTDPDETGTATLSVKWTGADVDSEKVLVSAEFVENTWSNGAVVAVTKEIMTDTSMGIVEGAVLITEADVTPGYWDVTEMTAAQLKANLGLSYYSSDYTIKLNVNENDKITLDLDEMFFNQTDFISYNIKDVKLVKATAARTESTGYKLFSDKDFSTTVSGSGSDAVITSPVFGTFANVTDKLTKTYGNLGVATGIGTYSYTDGKATLYFETDEVATEGGSEVFTLAIIFDDYYPNTNTTGVLSDSAAEYYKFSGYSSDNDDSAKDYYYSSVLGSLTYVKAASAPSPLVSRGYVTRYITLTVNDVKSVSANDYSDYVPYGAPGATGSSLVLGNGEGEEKEIELGTNTYEISDITAAYTYEGVTYGYVLNNTDNYIDYVKNNPTDFVKAEVDSSTIIGSKKDLVYALYFENTADYAVLPGKYTFTITVKETDSDGIDTYTKYPVNVYLYAPQYTVGLNSDVQYTWNDSETTYYINGNKRVENCFPHSDTDIHATLNVFTTYEWYDFDLARLVDVDNVTATLAALSNNTLEVGTSSVTANSYVLVDAGVSDSYTYSAFELFCYDPTNLRLTPDADELLAEAPAGTKNIWYNGLDVTFSSQDADAKNIIPVAAPGTDVADVVETVQLYTTVESGLILPVVLYDGASYYSSKGNGKFIVNVIANKVSAVSTAKVYKLASGDDAEPEDNNGAVIDLSADLELASAGIDGDGTTYYIYSEATRKAPVYTLLAKEGLAQANYTTIDGSDRFNRNFLNANGTIASFASYFTSTATFENRDYTASSLGDYTTAFSNYLAWKSITEVTESVLYDYMFYYYGEDGEETYDLEDGIDYDLIYSGKNAGKELSALIESQIGDGSADLYSTVNLFPDNCVTIAVGDLCMDDLGTTSGYPSGLAKTDRLIEIVDGVIYRASNVSNETTTTLYQKVTVKYTDIFGFTTDAKTVYVPLQF